jgi:tRNA(His) 5'-end guanylyltransferase
MQKSNTESLGDRITNYATGVNYIVPKEEHLIVRIDGHHFSSFTKGFDKPFDTALSNAMISTTRDLHNRFNAYSSFTQSDEITLFIPALNDKKGNFLEHQFGGRSDKINSLVAAFATKCFNKHLSAEYEEELYKHRENFEDSFRLTAEEQESQKHLARFRGKLGEAYFDCRCFGVPSIEEVFNTFMWRSRDCIKNSKSMMAQAYVSHKELQNKNGEEQIEYCLEKTGMDWNLIEDRFKYGVLVKKELYEIPDNNPNPEYNGGFVKRSRLVQTSISMNSFSPELVEIISKQYLEIN